MVWLVGFFELEVEVDMPAHKGPHGFYSQWKSWNFKQVREKSEKVREFYVPKSGENKRVRESQGKSKSQGAKVNKDAEKILNCFNADCVQQFAKFFFLIFSLADYLYLHFYICSATFVSSAIEGQHCYFT